jgi:hypothetical protein
MSSPPGGAIALAVTGLLAISACSGNSSGAANPPPPPATSTPAAASPSADPLKSQIAAAVQNYYKTYTTAVADPGNGAKVDALLALYTPTNPGRENARERMANFAASHTAGRPGPNGYFVIESVTDPNGSPDGPVTSRVCAYDDSVLYDSHQRAPDGKEIIVNDTPGGGLSDFSWVRQGNQWLLQKTTVIDTWEGQNKCPARSSS